MKITKKLLALAFVALLIGVAAATIYETYVIPSTGTVGEVALSITIADEEWIGQTIDWGQNLEPGQTYTKPLEILNSGDFACTLTMETPDLAVGLEQTWDLNVYTLAVDQLATGTLILTIATDAPAGTYNWDFIIIATT